MKLKLAILLILLIAVAQTRKNQLLGHHKESGEESQGNEQEEDHNNGEEKNEKNQMAIGYNLIIGLDSNCSFSNGGKSEGVSEPIEQQTFQLLYLMQEAQQQEYFFILGFIDCSIMQIQRLKQHKKVPSFKLTLEYHIMEKTFLGQKNTSNLYYIICKCTC